MKLKRVLAGFTAVFSLLTFACARAEVSFGENLVLQLSDSAVLVGADGTERVPRGMYASIESISPEGTPSEDELFRANLIGKNECVLLGASGDALTDVNYQYLLEENGLITFKLDGKYGVMDRALTVVIPPDYTQLVSNGEGGYIALTALPLDDRAAGVFYLEPGASETPTGVRILYDLGDFSEGLMPVIAAENKKVGYLNAKGEWTIKPQFTYAGPFKGGRAVANLESGVGVIDENGNWLLTPNYRAIHRSHNRGSLFLGVRGRSTICLIDSDTFEVARTYSGDSIFCGVFYSDNLAVIYDDESSRLIDAAGEVLMDFDADAGFDAHSGEAERVIVHMGDAGENLSWLYALNGTELFGPAPALRYLCNSGGRDLYSYAKFDIETQTEPGTDWEGAFEVIGTREVGIVDENGEILLTAGKYRDIAPLAEGFFAARTDDKVFVIDERGREYLKYDY